MTEFTGIDCVTLTEDFGAYTYKEKLKLIKVIVDDGEWEFEGDAEVTIDVEPPEYP